jgi:hypothetical protein
MSNDKFDSESRKGNEPAPLLLMGVALIPVLGVGGWMLGWFG